MVEYFRIAMPKGEWVGETQWFDGKQIAVTRKQLLATKPDAYSEAFQVALENKKYDLANPAWGYASLIETLTGSSPSRGGGVGKLKTTPQMAQRANGMPEETRHWLVLDARRQRILDPGTFAASLRRDLGTGNIFERFFLRLDDGMHEFPWE